MAYKILEPSKVLELIKEDPGNITIDEILEKIPKSSKKKANEFLDMLVEHIKNELLTVAELDQKKKKAINEIKQTKPMKALAVLKKDIKERKRKNNQMLVILNASRKMAKMLGYDVSNIADPTNETTLFDEQEKEAV